MRYLFSSDAILVDEAIIPKDGSVDIMCGSEIVPGPGGQGSTCLHFVISLKFSVYFLKHCVSMMEESNWYDLVSRKPSGWRLRVE